jgi:predicted O-methyltransferase YrrM
MGRIINIFHKLGQFKENSFKFFYKLVKPSLFSCFRVPGHLSEKESYALYKYAKKVSKDSKILEIGSYKGKSTVFLCKGSKSEEIYIVDTFTNIDMSEGPKNTFKDFYFNTRKYHKKLIIIKGLSGDASTISKIPGSLDLIFLDADHRYEAVKLDIWNYLPKLNKKGLFIFHDYGNPTGVKPALDEFISSGKLSKIKQVDSMLICQKSY